jgi:site-specific recombinase XerD
VIETVHKYFSYRQALGHSAYTLRTARYRLLKFAGFAAARGVKTVRNVSEVLVRDYHEKLIERGLKSMTRLTVMCTVRTFLHWAWDKGLMLSDVAARVELPAKTKQLPPTPLTPVEVVEFLELVKPARASGKRNRAALELLYACGLRRHELLRLTVADVDFIECTVFVRGKGGKERLLPVHDKALKAVRTYLKTRGPKLPKNAALLVMHRRGGKPREARFSTNALYALFRRVNKRFHKHVHPHLLRHCYACHLLQGGADLRHVQALLGHESPDTTAKYLGLVKDDLKRAYDLAAEKIREEADCKGRPFGEDRRPDE